MDVLGENDFDLEVLKSFLLEEACRLGLHISSDFDSSMKDSKQSTPEGNGCETNACANPNTFEKMSNSTNSRKVVKNTSSSKCNIDLREQEKEKLINSLSTPRSRYSCPTFTRAYKSGLSSPQVSVIDSREREKDRLAAIFAASKPSYLSKTPTNCSKSEVGRVSVHENEEQESIKARNSTLKIKSKEHWEGVTQQNSDIPDIFVTEYQEEPDSGINLDTRPSNMVRIGEFSPLNPSNMRNNPSQGIGEYGEERRKSMSDQRNQEYNEYLQQKQSRNETLCEGSSPHNRSRTVSTQTMWSDDVSNSYNEKEISPNVLRRSSLYSDRDFHCSSPSFRPSPITKCFDDHGEKEIKEIIYRQELKRQIEEKNRLREQSRKREEEEEARIEAKIQRDLEKMRRQYEEERLQRCELAIRRKEQEDFLRQRLADEQLKAQEEVKIKKKQCLRNKSISPNDKSSQKSSRVRHSTYNLPLSQPLPSSCASEALREVHDVFRQPLLEVPTQNIPIDSVSLSPPERDMPRKTTSVLNGSKNISSKITTSHSPSLPVQRINKVNAPRVVASCQTEKSFLPDASQEAAKKLKEVEKMLRAPLSPHPDRVLLPVSPPLVDATIPPYIPTLNPPVSPPLPASKRIQRSNCDILDNKWKVPQADTDSGRAPDNVFTSHNRSILTQLGAFRRHLQQEQLRMQQRVRDDSP